LDAVIVLLSLPSAARELGISRRTLEREIADGRLPVIEIRGAVTSLYR